MSNFRDAAIKLRVEDRQSLTRVFVEGPRLRGHAVVRFRSDVRGMDRHRGSIHLKRFGAGRLTLVERVRKATVSDGPEIARQQRAGVLICVTGSTTAVCPEPSHVIVEHERPQGNEYLVEANAGYELHDDVVVTVLLADAKDGHDVGMVQLGGRLGLSFKASQVPLIQQCLFRQHLDGDASSQGNLLGFVHDPHAAAANFAQDAEVTELLQGEAA